MITVTGRVENPLLDRPCSGITTFELVRELRLRGVIRNFEVSQWIDSARVDQCGQEYPKFVAAVHKGLAQELGCALMEKQVALNYWRKAGLTESHGIPHHVASVKVSILDTSIKDDE